ncbi:MAG: hypothetical protein C4538_11340 [Nitrospiraceae bacterium]|nr:MAG: hypothetical protein C4538_11340 [Nitrospiraceae bacterium]
MVLEVTAQDQDGKKIFSRQEEYSVNDFYFKGGKKVPMAEWDVTATEHFGLGIEPLTPETYTFVIPVSPDTQSVKIDTHLTYEYSREKIFTVQDVSQAVVIEK